jgi:hypothetical protein
LEKYKDREIEGRDRLEKYKDREIEGRNKETELTIIIPSKAGWPN